MPIRIKTRLNSAVTWVLALAVVSVVLLLTIGLVTRGNFKSEPEKLPGDSGSQSTGDASGRTDESFSQEENLATIGDTQTINFESSDSELVNPERGFHHAWETDAAGSNFPDFTNSDRTRSGGKTLARIVVRLDNYRNSSIDQPFLDRYNDMFASARNSGIKLTIRHTYNIPEASDGWICPAGGEPDAPLPRVQEHIRELGPLLRQNSDVIASIQGGFIGAWGEWHCSANNLTSPEGLKGVANAMLTELPEHLTFMVRTPMQKEVIVDTDQPMQQEEAFSGSDRSRLGHVNDCYLSSVSDTGTFEPADKIDYWKDYIGAESQFLPVGGETCFSTESAQVWGCSAASSENERQGWSFMNLDWYEPIIDSWRNDGCYDEFRDRLGYRLSLQEVRVSKAVERGGSLFFGFDVNNTGYAPPYNRRPVFLVLSNSSSRHELELPNVGAHLWPAGKTSVVESVLTVPSDIESGEYDLAIWLPDFHENLRDRSEYSIQLANRNVWDSTTGLNNLNATIQVN